jgi:hypothetical protein
MGKKVVETSQWTMGVFWPELQAESSDRWVSRLERAFLTFNLLGNSNCNAYQWIGIQPSNLFKRVIEVSLPASEF